MMTMPNDPNDFDSWVQVTPVQQYKNHAYDEAPRLGVVVGGSISKGLTIKLEPHVNVEELATTARFETVSDSHGEYHLLGLPAGRYSLSVEQPGFQLYQQTGIVLRIGDQTELNVKLQIGQPSQSVRARRRSGLRDGHGDTFMATKSELVLPSPFLRGGAGGGAFRGCGGKPERFAEARRPHPLTPPRESGEGNPGERINRGPRP